MSQLDFTAASLPANPNLCNEPVIFDGFGSEITPLNHILLDGMIALPFGRAYLRSESEDDPAEILPYYGAQIHVAPVGEYDHSLWLPTEAQMAKSERPGIYMGVAGMINFSYIAAIKPAGLILADANPLQKLYWDHTIKTSRNNPKVEDFINEMSFSEEDLACQINDALGQIYYRSSCLLSRKKRETDTDLFRMISARTYFHPDKNSLPEQRWWRSQDGYAHFHAMAKRDAIATLTLDMFHAPSWHQLERALAGNKISTLYASNILSQFNWMGPRKCSRDALITQAWENIGLIADLRKLRFIDHGGVANLSLQSALKHATPGVR